MGYPQHPGGYPPSSGGYQQYPGGAQPYPGQHQPYPVVPESAPSGATAIAAGALAWVSAVGQLLGGSLTVVSNAVDVVSYAIGMEFPPWIAVPTGLLDVLAGVLLCVGAIGIFRRSSGARVLIIVGCVIVIGCYITRAVWIMGEPGGYRHGGLNGGMGLMGDLVFPIATAVLALAPATTRWLRSGPPPEYRHPVPGQPPYSGYGVSPAMYPAPPIPPAAYGFPPAGYPAPAAQYPAPPTVAGAGWVADVPGRATDKA